MRMRRRKMFAFVKQVRLRLPCGLDSYNGACGSSGQASEAKCIKFLMPRAHTAPRGPLLADDDMG